MEIFSALMAICAGNLPVPGEFPAQRPATQNLGVFFYLRPNKRLSKQWWGWWAETPSSPLWRHCNVVGEPRWDSPCLPGPASLDQSVLPCSYPFLEIEKKGVVFIFNFGKLNSHSLITQGDEITYIYKSSIFNTDVLYNSLLYLCHWTKIDTDLMAHV